MQKFGWIVYGAIVCLLLAGIAVRILGWVSYPKPSQPEIGKKNLLGAIAAKAEHPLGPNPSEIFTDKDMLHLASAIVIGDTDDIRKALNQGAQINEAGKHGLTPLHLSLLSLQLDSFKELLNRGADPNLPAENGDAVMPLLALMQESDWLEEAIRHKGDPDRRDRRSRTPLMLAARNGRVENVLLLIASGAEIDAEDKHGETALFHSFQAFQPDLKIARALLSAGADPARVNKAGFTARDFANTFDNLDYLAIFPQPK